METVTKRTPATIMHMLAWILSLLLPSRSARQLQPVLIRKRVQSLFFVCALLLGSVNGWGQITQRGTATTNSVALTNMTSFTINKPSGVTAGDVMIASFVQNETDNDNGGMVDVSLSGWTLIDGRTIYQQGTSNGDNLWTGTVLYRVADGTEGADFTFSTSIRADMIIGSIVAFSGVDVMGGVQADGTSGGPFDRDPGTLNITNAVTSTATGVTTLSANAAVLMLSLVNNDRSFSGWTATNPATLTELYDNTTMNGDDASVGAAWAIRTTAGATGNGTVTLSGSDRSGAMFVVLKPCASSATINAVTLGSALSTIAGAPSSGVSFTAGGTGLLENITATAEPGFEVSTSQNSGYGAQVSVSGGTTVWVRFAASQNPGTYNSTTAVILTSRCAVFKNVTTSASNNIVDNAIALNALGTEATENFNTLASSGSSNTALPTGWYFTESGSNANSTYTADIGSSSTGDTYSFGASSSSERAFGGLRSSSLNPTIGAKFTNNTGASINNLFISYTGETWRVGNINRTDRLDFQYSLNATSLTTGTWTDFNGLDYTNTAGGSTASGSMLQSASIADVITGLNIPNGASFWIRWNDVDASGNDDGMAIDDLSIKPCGTVATPTASAQTFCGAANPTVADLTATGSGIQWYSNTSGGTSLAAGTGLTTGTYYASQTINGCESVSRTAVSVTVTAAPNAGSLSGTQTICSNGSTNFTSNGNSGGAWTSGNTSVATVNSSTGAISGVSAGTATITYTVTGTGGCANATATRTVTVTAAPNAGNLSGTQSVCVGSTTTFSSDGGAGSWTSSNTGIATVNSSTGIVTGVSAGTATITYTVTGTGGCANATATRTVTVTALPSAPAASGLQTFCSGATVADLVATGTSIKWYTTATGGSVLSSATSLATQYYYASQTENGCESISRAAVSVRVNDAPSAITAGVNNALVCAGTAVNLSSTTASFNASTAATLLSENFNGSLNGWTSINNSTGGTPANAAWTLRANGYLYNSETFSSNDASQFYFSNSDAQGSSSTTSTILQSPAFSTIGLSAAVLNFRHYFYPASGDTAYVEVSTNGTTWNLLTRYTGLTGTSSAFSNPTPSINSYLNQPTVYIRFRYAATYGWYWAIDNVSVTGTYSGTSGYAWTSSPAGFTSSLQNPSATPSVTTTYTVTASNPNGCTKSSNVTVTVIPSNTITLTSASGTAAQEICTGNAISAITYSTTGATGASFSGLPSGVTGNWDADVVTISGTPAATGTFNYTVTLTGGCGTVTANGSITVNGTNTITRTSAVATTAQTVCRNEAITNITYATTNATGASFSGLPAGVTGSWAANVVTISGVPSVAGSYSYTVTLTGGCTVVTASGTMVVNEIPTAFTVTGGGAYCSGGGGNVVGLDNTQTGVNYQLVRNGSTNVGAPVAGTGSSISFGAQTTGGTYTVVGTNATTGCIAAMSNAVSVSVTALASAPVIASINQPTCTVATATINLSGLPAGSWTIVRSPGAVASTGSGTTASYSGLAANTTYTFTVTPDGGCTSDPSANAVVNAQPATPTAPTAGSGSRCGTGSVTITATVGAGETIDWYSASAGGSVLSGGTGTTSFNTPSIAATTSYYAQTRNEAGCLSATRTEVVATVNTLPTITASATATSVAYGVASTTLSYSAVSNNPTTYSISWNSSPANSFAAVSNENLSGSPISISIPSGTNAGTYTGSLTVTNGLGCASVGSSFTVTINTVPLTITGVIADNKVYDGNTTAVLSGTAQYSGLQNGETFSVSGTPAATFNNANVGTSKAVTVTGYTAPNSNYTITQPSLTADITAAPLTITADEKTKATGSTLTTPQTGSVEFTAEGLVGAETIGSVTITITNGYQSAAAAGTYTDVVVPSAATGGTFNAANYSITYVAADLIVGTTIYSRATGNWNSTNTWSYTSGGTSCGCTPVSTDNVILRSQHTVTVNVTDAACAKMELGGNAANTFGVLTFAATGNPKLTVSGQMIVGGTGSTNTNRRGEVDLIGGATLEVGELVLSRTTGTANPAIFDMTGGGTLIAGTITVGIGTVTWTPSTGTVVMKSTSTLPASSSLATFHNLTINEGVVTTSGRDLTINGVFTVNGTFLPGTSSHDFRGLSGSLTGSGTIGISWLGTTALETQYYITTRTVTNLTVDYMGAGNQSIPAGTYGGLISSGTGTKTLLGSTSINNDVLISAGSTLSAGSNQALNVKGNFTNNGTFSPASGTVTFNGTGSQAISGTSSFYNFTVSNTASNITLASGSTTSISNTFTPNGTSFGSVTGSGVNFNGTNQNIPAFTFHNLSINGGGTKTMQGEVNVGGQLTLTSGLLSIGNNDLFVTAGNASAITGAGTGSYIVTGGTGALKYSIGGAGEYILPVGSASVYNPMNLTWSAAPGITRLDVRYIPSTVSVGTGLPTNVFGCETGSVLLNNGYWSVAAQGTLSNSPIITLTRRGHSNAGQRRSAHGIVRRDNTAADWFLAGVWTDNGNDEVTPASTGPVLIYQDQLNAFGEIAIAKGTGNASTGIWTGATDNDAQKAANWGCNTVPTTTIDVIIPRNVRNNPTIVNGDIAARNLTINDGAILNMAGSRNITLANTSVFTNNGTFNGGNQGSVTFLGSGTIAGTSNTTFHHLILNGVTTLSTLPTVNHNLQLNDNASVSAAPNYGNNAALVYNMTNTGSTGNEWTGNGSSSTAGLPNTVRLSGSGTISLSGNRSVPGTLELNGGTLDVQSYTLSIYDELSISGGGFNAGAAGIVSFAKASAGQEIAAANYGNLSFSNYSKELPNSGTIGIAGTFNPGTAEDHTTNNSTISFNGSSAQTIPAFNYHNLTVGGSDVKTAGSALNIPGNMVIAGTFNAGTFSHVIDGNWINNGTFTHGGGTIQFDGSTTISGTSENTFKNVLVTGALTAPNANMNVNGNWTVNGGTFTPGAGTVTFNNTDAPQTISGTGSTFGFHHLVIANAGQTVSVQGGNPIVSKVLNLTGNMTLNSGTLSASFTEITMAGGNWTNNGATFTSGGSRVAFTSTTQDQAINGSASSQTFAKLIMNKAGRTLSLSGSTTRLNITDTFALQAGTYDAGTTDSLKVGGNWVITGGSFTPGVSTVAFNGSGEQNIPAQTYHKLSVINGSTKRAIGNITVNDEMNISSGMDLDMDIYQLVDGGSLNATGSGTLRTKNTGSNPLPNGKTWSFGVAYEGTDAQTVNYGTYNGGITVNNNSYGAGINGNTIAAAVTLSSGDLSINANTLTLNGTFSGSVNNALRGSASSNLTIGTAATAGILYFRNAGSFNTVKDLRFMASASATLGNRLNIVAGATAGKVKVEANSAFASNGNLVLKSDTLGTAYVDEIENCTSCTPITGEVEVERAMPNKRTWRLVTIPVTGSYTLRQQLTRQGSGAAVEYPAPFCNGQAAPAATGYGTMITGHSMSSCANASAVGADLITTGGHSSVRRYTHINGAGSWASNNSTNAINFNAVPDQDGYLMFIRGDRSQLGSGSNATTFRFRGTLKQGNALSTQTINANYGVMSNPYAAPVNVDDVFNNGTGNTAKFERNVWVWDGDKTGANGLGGYRSLSYDGVSAYTCGDCGGGNPEGQQFLTLNTGQAFMVQRKAGVTEAVSMTVKESDKVSSNGNIATMRTAANARLTNSTVPALRVQLHRANGANLESFADATTARFNKIYQANTNEPYDVYKYNNNDENISLVRSGKYLVIESRPMPSTTDTLYLPFWSTTNRGYALSIQTENFNAPGLAAELIDSFTNTRTQVPLNGSTLVYPFSVTSNAASKSLSRFRVVFTQGASLPVNFVNVRAQVKNSSRVQVEWEVAQEENLQQYEVERSADGNTFTKMAEQSPRNLATNHTYSWMDAQPNAGNNFYRIKAVDNDGTFRYSATVKVNLGGAVQDVRVYPTTLDQPTVSLELTDQPAGIYEISMSNALGQMIFNRNIQHVGGNAVMTVDLSSYSLTAGVHFFCIKDQDGNKKSVKLLVKK